MKMLQHSDALNKKPKYDISSKIMETAGIEPATFRMRSGRSTTELSPQEDIPLLT